MKVVALVYGPAEVMHTFPAPHASRNSVAEHWRNSRPWLMHVKVLTDEGNASAEIVRISALRNPKSSKVVLLTPARKLAGKSNDTVAIQHIEAAARIVISILGTD